MNFVPKGIIIPTVTPVTADGKINEPVLRQMTEHFIKSGIHGLFPMGTSGEFYAFKEDEYRQVLSVTLEQAAGRVPVYAGATSITTQNAIAQVKIAKEVGVDAVSVLTPMFISQTQDEIYEFYRAIAESTDLPIIIYNNKPKTNVTVTPDTIAKLAEIDNIVGVKDSTGDFTNTEEYLRLTRGNSNFHVLMGRDTLIFAALCYGATGAVASCANVAPKITADIYDKFVAGDYKGALEAQFLLAPLRIASNMGTFPAVIKEGMNLQGIDVGKCIDPIQEITPDQKNKLAKVLKDMNLI
jgi:4-hydroxy-tetrahydrodipicolinate synthase